MDSEVDGLGCYAFSPHPKWKVIVLDAYDEAVIGWPRNSEKHRRAAAMLHTHNPTKDPRWNGSPPGVRPGELKDRWRALNGAISAEQLAWLEGELQAAQAQAQRALIVSHCPMHPEAVPGVTATLLWNYEDVLAVLWRHPRVVAATVAGHVHRQNHYQDACGIYHLTMPALLETAPTQGACHGIVSVHDDSMHVAGFGTLASGAYAWPSEPAAARTRTRPGFRVTSKAE